MASSARCRDDAYRNRLLQYVRKQFGKRVHGSVIRKTLDSLGARLKSLDSLASKGVHNDVSAAEAESCIVWTYLLAADIVRIADGSSVLLVSEATNKSNRAPDALVLSMPVGRSITSMGKNPAQLSQKQVNVLQWIKEGCPGGVYEQGYEHRIIARALERRGLVIISGRGPTWSAAIAEAGLAWETAPPAEVMPPESEADQLIERVLEAGGRLVLPDDRDAEKTHERLIRMSLRSSNRPLGKKLEMRSTGRWGHGPKEIVLAEHFDDYVDPAPVPVPERVGKYHPMVKAFLDDKEWQYVTRDHLSRAARILQAIAVEAPKRGIEVLSAAQSTRSVDQHQARELARAHLVLKTPTGLYGVMVRELPGRGAKKMEPRRWNERKTKPAWIENRGWEFISTGKLELVVDGPGTAYNGDHYRDAKTVTVEDKLLEAFRSFEIYRLRAEWQERERQREKAERQRQWEAAREQAKRRYDQHIRWEHFMESSREWHAIRQHREFLAAAWPVVDSLDSVQRTDFLEQLELAERTLNEIDAIQHPELFIPDVPDPKPDDLKPFLDGWSPHGPDGRSWSAPSSAGRPALRPRQAASTTELDLVVVWHRGR